MEMKITNYLEKSEVLIVLLRNIIMFLNFFASQLLCGECLRNFSKQLKFNSVNSKERKINALSLLFMEQFIKANDQVDFILSRRCTTSI